MGGEREMIFHRSHSPPPVIFLALPSPSLPPSLAPPFPAPPPPGILSLVDCYFCHPPAFPLSPVVVLVHYRRRHLCRRGIPSIHHRLIVDSKPGARRCPPPLPEEQGLGDLRQGARRWSPTAGDGDSLQSATRWSPTPPSGAGAGDSRPRARRWSPTPP